MGDECTCEKCSVNSAHVQDALVWRVEGTETPSEGRGMPMLEQYLVVGKVGIALRKQTSEGVL